MQFRTEGVWDGLIVKLNNNAMQVLLHLEKHVRGVHWSSLSECLSARFSFNDAIGQLTTTIDRAVDQKACLEVVFFFKENKKRQAAGLYI